MAPPVLRSIFGVGPVPTSEEESESSSAGTPGASGSSPVGEYQVPAVQVVNAPVEISSLINEYNAARAGSDARENIMNKIIADIYGDRKNISGHIQTLKESKIDDPHFVTVVKTMDLMGKLGMLDRDKVEDMIGTFPNELEKSKLKKAYDGEETVSIVDAVNNVAKFMNREDTSGIEKKVDELHEQLKALVNDINEKSVEEARLRALRDNMPGDELVRELAKEQESGNKRRDIMHEQLETSATYIAETLSAIAVLAKASFDMSTVGIIEHTTHDSLMDNIEKRLEGMHANMEAAMNWKPPPAADAEPKPDTVDV